jgi:1,4-alpha-glucan branching enzyme
MALGRVVLCLHSHMPYVLSHGKSPHGTDWLMESAAECYLPLLRSARRLVEEGALPKWTVNVTPILAEQLADPSFAAEFEAYCKFKIDAAVEDARRFGHEGQLRMQGIAGYWARLYEREIEELRALGPGGIVGGLKAMQDEGAIELITSCATHGYLPLLGTDESVRAQVGLGAQTYRKHFGRDPKGFWLPECAYRPAYEWKAPAGPEERPWMRAGVEEILAENGLEYFFVDSHMIRGGAPLGTYHFQFPKLAEMFARSSRHFEPPEERRSEYDAYALPNGIRVFARDPRTTVKVWSGEYGYPGDERYLEFHKQLYPGRLRYWRVTGPHKDLGAKEPYDPWLAFERIQHHALDFVDTLKGALAHHLGDTGRQGTVVAMYDTELFGHWWFEGPEFLFEVGRALSGDADVIVATGSEAIRDTPLDGVIRLPEGSWGEGGYHTVWLNDSNAWTWEKLYAAERSLRAIVESEPQGQAKSVTEQAARELLLAEASDWQFLISTFSAGDYAELRFQDHIERFERLALLVQSLRGGATLSPVEREYVDECRTKDAAFAEIDLSLWRRSLAPA